MESGPHKQYPYGKGDGPPEKDKIKAAVITPDWQQLQTSDEESKACYQRKAERKSTC